MYVYTYIHVDICIHTCSSQVPQSLYETGLCVYINTYIHVRIHTYIHTCSAQVPQGLYENALAIHPGHIVAMTRLGRSLRVSQKYKEAAKVLKVNISCVCMYVCMYVCVYVCM